MDNNEIRILLAAFAGALLGVVLSALFFLFVGV